MNNIRLAKIEDIKEIKNIIDEGISKDYYSTDVIKQYINDENRYLLVAVSNDDKPVAAMFCVKGSLEEMCKEEHIQYPDDIFNDYTPDTKTVVYKTASTYASERRNGYIHRLFEEYGTMFDCIEHDLRLGLAIILPDGSVPIKTHVDASGFKPVKLIKSPWSSINSYCNYCKKDYCICDGMLYIKENKS